MPAPAWPPLVDDSGTKRDGTVVDVSLFELIFAAIEDQIVSDTNPDIDLAALIDEIIEARNGYPSLDDRLDAMESDTASGSGADIDGTAGENLLMADICYLSDGSAGGVAGRWYKADADFAYSSTIPQLAFCIDDLIAAATGRFRRGGRISGLAGLIPGAPYYVSQTAGLLTLTPPSNFRPVGVADSATSLIIQLLTDDTAERLVRATINSPLIGNIGVGVDVILTETLPGRTLRVTNSQAIIVAFGLVSDRPISKKIEIKFGAAALTAHLSTTPTTGTWQIALVVIRRPTGQILLLSGTGSGGTAAMNSNIGAAMEDLDLDVPVLVTAEVVVPVWLVNTPYALNAIVRPTVPNGHHYKCTDAGTSHTATEPVWPTGAGATVTDGVVDQITWTEISESDDIVGQGIYIKRVA